MAESSAPDPNDPLAAARAVFEAAFRRGGERADWPADFDDEAQVRGFNLTGRRFSLTEPGFLRQLRFAAVEGHLAVLLRHCGARAREFRFGPWHILVSSRPAGDPLQPPPPWPSPDAGPRRCRWSTRSMRDRSRAAYLSWRNLLKARSLWQVARSCVRQDRARPPYPIRAPRRAGG